MSCRYEKGVGGARNRGEMAKGWFAFGIGIPERVGILGDKNVRGGEGLDTRKGRHIAWERSKEKERLAHKTRARAFAVRGPSGWACSYQSTLA